MEILYVLQESLSERKRKEKIIRNTISFRKAKLNSRHYQTVCCLMKDDGFLQQSGDTYITTKIVDMLY